MNIRIIFLVIPFLCNALKVIPSTCKNYIVVQNEFSRTYLTLTEALCLGLVLDNNELTTKVFEKVENTDFKIPWEDFFDQTNKHIKERYFPAITFGLSCLSGITSIIALALIDEPKSSIPLVIISVAAAVTAFKMPHCKTNLQKTYAHQVTEKAIKFNAAYFTVKNSAKLTEAWSLFKEYLEDKQLIEQMEKTLKNSEKDE